MRIIDADNLIKRINADQIKDETCMPVDDPLLHNRILQYNTARFYIDTEKTVAQYNKAAEPTDTVKCMNCCLRYKKECPKMFVVKTWSHQINDYKDTVVDNTVNDGFCEKGRYSNG